MASQGESISKAHKFPEATQAAQGVEAAPAAIPGNFAFGRPTGGPA
jgi:hypothetical protein